jgi:hypothetical protein
LHAEISEIKEINLISGSDKLMMVIGRKGKVENEEGKMSNGKLRHR